VQAGAGPAGRGHRGIITSTDSTTGKGRVAAASPGLDNVRLLDQLGGFPRTFSGRKLMALNHYSNTNNRKRLDPAVLAAGRRVPRSQWFWI